MEKATYKLLEEELSCNLIILGRYIMDKVTVDLHQALKDSLTAEIKRLKDEIEMWKDRYEAERQAHEATTAGYERTLRGIMYGHN